MFSGLPRETVCQETGQVLYQVTGFKRELGVKDSASAIALHEGNAHQTGDMYMHRDDEITNEQWKVMCDGLSEKAKGCVTNWFIHGMRLTKQPDGIRLDRRDYVAEGKYRFVSNDGTDKVMSI